MNHKLMAALLTKEEQLLVQTANTVNVNVIYKLLEALARERHKVQGLEYQLRKVKRG